MSLGTGNKMLGEGVTCDGLASHPGGVAILLLGFMLQKPRYLPAVWATLARGRLYLSYLVNKNWLVPKSNKPTVTLTFVVALWIVVRVQALATVIVSLGHFSLT